MSFFPIPQTGCTASGSEAVALGSGCIASGNQSVALGQLCTASALNATAIGGFNVASAFGATALGESNTSSADSTFTAGDNNVASAYGASCLGVGNTVASQFSTACGQNNSISSGTDYSFATGTFNTINDLNAPGAAGTAIAMGTNNTCSNYMTMAIGNTCIATGDTSFAWGTLCSATNAETFAWGSGCTASGTNSMAYGVNCLSVANSACARGVYAKATIPGQDAFSSQRFAALAAGISQTSVVTQVGSTPGAGAGEGVELAGGGTVLTLTDSRTYAVKYTVAVSGAGPLSRMFSGELVVRRTGGVSTIVASGTQVSLGDAGAVSWTLTPTIGVVPDRLYFAFNTVATTTATKIVARVELTEIAF